MEKNSCTIREIDFFLKIIVKVMKIKLWDIQKWRPSGWQWERVCESKGARRTGVDGWCICAGEWETVRSHRSLRTGGKSSPRHGAPATEMGLLLGWTQSLCHLAGGATEANSIMTSAPRLHSNTTLYHAVSCLSDTHSVMAVPKRDSRTERSLMLCFSSACLIWLFRTLWVPSDGVPECGSSGSQASQCPAAVPVTHVPVPYILGPGSPGHCVPFLVHGTGA